MSETNDLLYKIALSRLKGIGCIKAKKIIAQLGSVEAIFKEKKSNLIKIEGVGEIFADKIVNNSEALELAAKELEFIEKYKITPLFYLDKNFPKRLFHCEDSPVLIYVKGNVDFENHKTVSIVGTRNATSYGKSICENIVKDISDRGHQAVIISGLAYGIDIEAHKAALKYGLNTVAVLAHGLHRIYPSVHKKYAKQIIEQGALVSEFSSKEDPERQNFVKRNRIIAGLADVTIVVESGKKGGALITADIANSYNRDVFAVPGKTGDIWSEGCNKLIKTNKAALIESVEDIEYLTGWEVNGKKHPVQKKLFIELPEEAQDVYQLVKENKQLSIDQIAIRLSKPVSKISPVLLTLEFEGLIKSLPGNIYKLL